MNKEVEKIRNKIMSIKDLYDGCEGDLAYLLQEVLDYIDSLQEEPVSEELEEAAELHSSSYGRYEIMENPYSSVKYAFESGAEWKEEKLLENGVKTHFDVGLPANIWQKLKEKGVNDGDELLIVKA